MTTNNTKQTVGTELVSVNEIFNAPSVYDGRVRQSQFLGHIYIDKDTRQLMINEAGEEKEVKEPIYIKFLCERAMVRQLVGKKYKNRMYKPVAPKSNASKEDLEKYAKLVEEWSKLEKKAQAGEDNWQACYNNLLILIDKESVKYVSMETNQVMMDFWMEVFQTAKPGNSIVGLKTTNFSAMQKESKKGNMYLSSWLFKKETHWFASQASEQVMAEFKKQFLAQKAQILNFFKD